MAIVFACACGKRLRAPDGAAGKLARCTGCGAVVAIPTPEETGSEFRGASARAIRAPGPAEDEDRDEGGSYDLADAPPRRPVTRPPAPSPSPPAPSHWHSSPRDPEARSRRAVAAVATPDATDPDPSIREFLYLVLALALIPLAFSLLGREDGSFKERLDRTMGNASPEVVARVERVIQSGEDASIDDLLAALPGGRVDASAHLPRQTSVHWLYGAFAAAAFLALVASLFPGERKSPAPLLLVGLFTGTIGVLLLLGCQTLAGATQGVWIRGRGLILVAFYVAKFIGFSYASASDPDSNFLLSFVGFTCGVGLCEELCKALPLLVYFRRDARMGWRGACVWGLASGVGFGVSEGILYSTQHYNGISPAGIYVVRFVSCVALHAIWSGSIGITLWRRQESIQGDTDGLAYGLALLQILAVPMVLHGLYDTLLKKDMNVLALAVGVLGFSWFVWQVESVRGDIAGEPRGRLARA